MFSLFKSKKNNENQSSECPYNRMEILEIYSNTSCKIKFSNKEEKSFIKTMIKEEFYQEIENLLNEDIHVRLKSEFHKDIKIDFNKNDWKYDLYYPFYKKARKRIEEFKLQMEMLPASAWKNSLANGLISKEEWDILRKYAYSKEDYHCQICKENKKGIKGGLHAHEIWEFNEFDKIQKLINIVALCPKCHHAIHIGFTNTQGQQYFEEIKRHYMKVNNCTEYEFDMAFDMAVDKCSELSFTYWKQDISFAQETLKKLKR